MPARFASKASFHEEAEKEFLEAAGEYATESDDLADEFEAEVRRGIESILEYPEMAPASPAPRSCASETAAPLLGIEDLSGFVGTALAVTTAICQI